MNVIDYLAWRGDLTLGERPFNDADNLVFATLAYINFSAVAADGKSATLEEASAADCPACIAGDYPLLLKAAAESERFGKTVVSDYVDIIDSDEELTQFCAMRFSLPDGTDYIAFRGTDDTIVGWREDFCISFEIAAAQKRAVEYMNRVMKTGGRYYVGGHSKGGNLAVYGSMACAEERVPDILRIFNNDGPGICPEHIDESRFALIEKRITRIVPEHSIIGMLFENTSEKLVAKSSGTGLLQHFPLTWQVEREGMSLCEDTDRTSKILNTVFDNWIERADEEHRKVFTDEFFGALAADGAVRMQDIPNGGIGGFAEILHSMIHSDEKAKETMKGLFAAFAEAIKNGEFLPQPKKLN